VKSASLTLLFIIGSFLTGWSELTQSALDKKASAAVDLEIKDDTNVADVLEFLGEEPAMHRIMYNEEQVRQGEEIVKYGRTTRNGKRSKRVSKHYACTSCHNVEREDPVLWESNPDTRLDYVKKKGLPFLQGTTFKGIANRESWYNDDYVKKYGTDKIELAHGDLREATQLCAVECAQGRPMKMWEMDAVLAYYWSLQYTLADLDMSTEELDNFSEMIQENKTEESIKFLKSKYFQQSPANFFDSPPDKSVGYEGLQGDPVRGRDIYDLSCQHCHQPDGVSHYVMDNSKMTFRQLKRNITKDSHFSLYQIIAYGTYALPGHRPYMPHYPIERMSLQQVEDLRAYIEQEAQ